MFSALPSVVRALVAPAPTLLASVLLVACGSTPPPGLPAAAEPDYWGYSRTVETSDGSVSLFDPNDLRHHRSDPEGWHRQGFAFRTDLATGRFVALSTEQAGELAVRVTSAPLSMRERAAAGPQATLRLRIQNRRLLLAGGDAWPSLENIRVPKVDDERWMTVPNGDYRVTMTVLDDSDARLHDVVFQFEEVATINDVAYAPGVPQLIVGRAPGVIGNRVAELQYRDRCDRLPAEARWSPLVEPTLALPGTVTRLRTIESLHARGRELQAAALPANEPMIVARKPNVGALGVAFLPKRWREVRREQGLYRELFEVDGHTLCTVRITDLNGLGEEMRVKFEPLRLPRDRLSDTLARRLADTFESHVAINNDPAWRYKSAWVRHAPDDNSLVLGVMRHLALPAEDVEALLLESNEVKARLLIERMSPPS